MPDDRRYHDSYDAYPDLLSGEGNADQDMAALVELLHDAYTTAARPPGWDATASGQRALRQHVDILGASQPRGTARSSPRLAPRPADGRLSAAGAAAFMALLVAGAVFLLSRAGELSGNQTPTVALEIPGTATAAAARRATGPAPRPSATAARVIPADQDPAVEGAALGVIAVVMDGSLYIVNSDGSDLTLLVPGSSSAGGVSEPAWSPDGRRIAYGAPATGSNPKRYPGWAYYIHIADADGGAPARFSERYYTMSPAWSPDGESIAYVQTRRIGEGRDATTRDDVYVADVDGASPRLLAEDAGAPSWSPDGERLAFHTRNRGIHVVNADGTGRRRLPATGARDKQPQWSPRGTRIAFKRGRTDASGHIYVTDADGRRATRITDRETTSPPAWAPDGGRIAYGGRDASGRPVLLSADASGGVEKVSLGGLEHEIDDLAWSPAGLSVAGYSAFDSPPAFEAPLEEADDHRVLKLNGVVYDGSLQGPQLVPLGDKYATTARRVAVDGSESSTDQFGHGDSTSPAGAVLYAVQGYKPEYKLAARDPEWEDRLVVYTATDPTATAKSGADLFDLGEGVRSIRVTDGERSEPAALARGAIEAPEQVSRLIEIMLRAPLGAGERETNAHARYSVEFELGSGAVIQPELHLLRLPSAFWEAIVAAVPTDKSK